MCAELSCCHERTTAFALDAGACDGRTRERKAMYAVPGLQQAAWRVSGRPPARPMVRTTEQNRLVVGHDSATGGGQPQQRTVLCAACVATACKAVSIMLKLWRTSRCTPARMPAGNVARQIKRDLYSLSNQLLSLHDQVCSGTTLCPARPVGQPGVPRSGCEGSRHGLLIGGVECAAMSFIGQPLLFACKTGDVAAVRRLLKAHPNVNSCGADGMTPLMIAVR